MRAAGKVRYASLVDRLGRFRRTWPFGTAEARHVGFQSIYHEMNCPSQLPYRHYLSRRVVGFIIAARFEIRGSLLT
jgi:hypothetical protein